MKNNLITLISSICLILVLTALPCLAAEAKPTSEVKTLNIGSTQSLNTAVGVDMKKAIELIIDDINKSGGLTVKGQKYKVNVIIYDDGFSADKARAAAERLIYQDKVKYIVGVTFSQPAAAMVGVTEQNKVLLIAGSATSKVVAPGTRYTIRTSFQRTFAVGGLQYLKSKLPKAKTMILIAADDEGGHASVPIWEAIAPKFGISTGVLYHPQGETDFSPLAAKIVGLDPDVVNPVVSQGGRDFGLQLRALFAAGFKGRVFNSSIVSMSKVSEIATNEGSEGALCQVLSFDNPNAPKYIKEFKRKFTERYGTWTDLHPIWMSAWYAFFAAVKKADSLEVDDILNAMRGLKFDALVGQGCLMVKGKLGVQNVTPDRYCDLCAPIPFGYIHNGQVVWEKEITAEEIVKASEPLFGEKWLD